MHDYISTDKEIFVETKMANGKPGFATASRWFMALLLSALLAGCGGGGGGAPTTIVEGQGNFGAAIVGGTVQMVCAGDMPGTTVTTSATGGFTVAALGSAPCVIKISGGNLTGGPFYSIFEAGQTRANVNQLTTMLAFLLADGSPETFFTSPGTISTKITAAAVATDKETVRANVVANLASAVTPVISTSFDFLKTAFTANSTGFDQMLDKLGFASTGNTAASITFNGSPILAVNPTTNVASTITSTPFSSATLVAAGSSGNAGAATTSGGALALTVNAPSITEPAGAGTKALTFVLTLGSAPATAITVDFATLMTGSATSGVDFVAATGTVNFAAGKTVATVSITVNGDATAEANETVLVQFSGTSLAATVTGTGTILANDTPGITVALTAGGTDNTASLGLTANDDTISGTIDQNTPASGTLQAGDIFNGGGGTDTLTLTPLVAVDLTLDDLLFTGVTGMDKIVITTTTTGTQSITGAMPKFFGAFGTAGVDLDTTSTTGAMTINTSSFAGPTTLAATSDTGAQTITTGAGVATVISNATTGSRTINTAASVVSRVTLTSGQSLAGNTIVTGTGNDIITIVIGIGAASTIGNTITGGLGADTITLTTDASIDRIVIADGDSGITVATADSITNFTALNDFLKMGLAGTGANYTEAGVAVADFAAALAAANVALNGTVRYSFQFVVGGLGTTGYLFKDTDGDGTADQVVVLVGVDNTGFAFTNIIP